MTAAQDAKAPRADGILGNAVETDRHLLETKRSVQGFRGTVMLSANPASPEEISRAAEICPSKAISASDNPSIDIGRCIMCGICQEVAPRMFTLESSFTRPTKERRKLIVAQAPEPTQGGTMDEIGGRLSEQVRKRLGRSLAIREVDAGSCNGCEVEISALNNPVYDIERFGVRFVASPRHADVLLVTGVASRNLESALLRTYEATPDPKVVVAVGACACSGGIFGNTYASGGGIGALVPVDVFVPGCPPRPEAILYGVLLAFDRVRGGPTQGGRLDDTANGRRA